MSRLHTWQISMSANVAIDWTQSKVVNALTLPVGLGLSKTVRNGKIPVRLSLEADYAVVRPRSAPGDEWTFQFAISPTIAALF